MIMIYDLPMVNQSTNKEENKKKKGNVDVRVARIFNTFGPRMNPADGRVVSNFIVQVTPSFYLDG